MVIDLFDIAFSVRQSAIILPACLAAIEIIDYRSKHAEDLYYLLLIKYSVTAIM